MDLWSSALVSLVLITSAIGLLMWHIRSWRAVQSRAMDEHDRNYRHRQFRRRVQTSAMLGVLGVAVFAGQPLTRWAGSWLFAVLYWAIVLLLVLWMALLALADIVATHFHFSRLRTDYLIKRAQLQAELRRIRAGQGNGEARKRPWRSKGEK